MYNLGLEHIIPSKNKVAWSPNDLYRITRELDSHLSAVYNMSTIAASMKKYGRTRQLKDLVGASFEEAGVSFSMEGIVESIKNFFKRIGEAFTRLWNWFIGLFSRTKKQAKDVVDNDKLIKEAGNAENASPEKKRSIIARLKARFRRSKKSEEAASLSDHTYTITLFDIDAYERLHNEYSGLLYNGPKSLGEPGSAEFSSNIRKLFDEFEPVYDKAIDILKSKKKVRLSIRQLIDYHRKISISSRDAVVGLSNHSKLIRELNKYLKEYEEKLLREPSNESYRRLVEDTKLLISYITRKFDSVKTEVMEFERASRMIGNSMALVLEDSL